jgi:2-iminobutanoate/2-iminopropanoate deaminase
MSPVSTPLAPAAIGPYSQAVAHGGVLYCSGQIAIDPATATVVEGSVAVETARVLANLDAVLRAGGTSPQHVLSTTVYLVDMAHFAEMNEVYAAFFGAHRPARATVAVSGLPKGVRVEIGAIAAVP